MNKETNNQQQSTNNYTVGVLGAGSMGSGIAQVAATYGHQVILVDLNSEALINAEESLNKILARLVEKGRIEQTVSDTIIGNIKFSENITDFQDCGIVIEAIIEDIEIKQKVFNLLENVVNTNCILANNTSSLSIASIASFGL